MRIARSTTRWTATACCGSPGRPAVDLGQRLYGLPSSGAVPEPGRTMLPAAPEHRCARFTSGLHAVERGIPTDQGRPPASRVTVIGELLDTCEPDHTGLASRVANDCDSSDRE